jgi:uncharacterized protein YjbI with pentapeptide repeats
MKVRSIVTSITSGVLALFIIGGAFSQPFTPSMIALEAKDQPLTPGLSHSRLWIVTGGQTGVDRATLDTALSLFLPVRGWCPKGRIAEDGIIPPVYPLQETTSTDYAVRTEWNVRDSDGTLILAYDFTNATLQSSNFCKASLIQTCWHEAKMLDRVRPGTTYLQNANLREWLVVGQGQHKNFDRQDLRGVNFQGANLVDASFIGADLSQTNLQDTNLSRAKLVQTQLNGTDLTGATLTGAYIQDWGISTDTKFDGVRCEYVYMRLPTEDNPDPHRKPDNRQEVFADGEFGDFIKPIFDTLDLYHNQGVDPRAIAIAFKELAENNPEAELEIVAIERRGEDKILLRAKTALTANKSELSRNYFINYNQLKALAEKDFKTLIAEKEYQINKLENMITTALERPSFYAQTYQNQGDTIMSEGSKKQSNFDLKGAQFAGGLVNADTVNAQQIGGNITNYSPEQRQNLAEAAAEIQQLLNQLGQTYPTNTPLEKQIAVTEALKQIDSNPTLKARVVGALKSGGTEALKELVDHPLVNILLATLEGWQDAE